ncbi:nitrate reductase molybdenum cofactor assembly chaperone [Effusibacillus lacus]|uniref:Nitrate reductase molybdenum cofactor assembly chaperone n=1 Tax=Effusibacillus lacus TaxID=1348429 RepID=A0A292YRK7_9BACL|nr:nitrate reductase molybdenum cofactor assembly chaperone [Effusibacillus lacus]TCS76081.1 respiratory nitrate reductase chaperone NarJ [Effusibacillus lacus]GAX91403.1 nitrate reductase molybdenum cofactor assembly chaperone [Effusibacillus lacus]
MTTFTSTPHSVTEIDVNRLTFQLVSLLLQYPDEEWLHPEELRELACQVENRPAAELINRFVSYLETEDLNDFTEKYVNTFDFNPKTNLYLTYSASGEERERGEVLVRIKEFYKEAGFEVSAEELPDYLPMILEFASVAPMEPTLKALKDFRQAIQNLQAELDKSGSPYAWLIQACLLEADRLDQLGGCQQ